MLTLIEINNSTLDLEVAQGDTVDYVKNPDNRLVLTHELFSELLQSNVFKEWLGMMNQKIGVN